VPALSSSPAGLEAGEIPDRIEPAEAKQLVDGGQAIVLDVSKARHGERIAGALRAQPNDLTGWLSTLPQGKSVVTYCT
jgi:rhodanese-related sulfurtransferase